jgi:hypothetical protein
MTLRWLCATCLCAFGVLSLQTGLKAEVIVPNTSTWKWLHPTDGTDPTTADEDFHTTFFLADFDDSAWKSGADKPGPHGGFGYGEQEFEGVEIGEPPAEHRKTAYLRLKFTTDQEQANLVLKCQRDDGIIVYLDGKEVLRNNLEAGAKEAYDMFATDTVSGDGETTVETLPLPQEVKLGVGEHILAVSLHNRATTNFDGQLQPSSDLRIAEISLESNGEAAK